MSKIKKIFIVIIGLLLLGTCGFTAYYLISLNNPQKLFTRTIDLAVSKTNNMINQNSLIDTAQGKYSVNTKVDIDVGDIVFSNYDYELEFNIDKNSKKLYAEVGALKKDNKVLSANILADSQNIYANLPELYSKTISLGSIANFWEMYENVNTPQKEDYIYLLTFFKNSFLNSLTPKDYTSENITIKVNNKDIKAKKSTLLLTKEKQKEILNNIINDIASDNKAKKLIATLMDIEEDKLIENLKKDNNYEGEDLEFCMYTKLLTNKVVKINAYNAEKQEIFNLDIDDNIYNFYVYSYSTDIWNKNKVTKSTQNIIVKKEDKNKYNIKILNENNEIATINVNENNNAKIDLDYVLKLDPKNAEEIVKGKFKLTTTQENKNSVNTKTNLEINYKENNFKINLDTTQKNSVNIKNVNAKNVINIDDMTENDMNQIQNNLLKNDFIKNLIKDFMKYSTTYGVLNDAQQKANGLNTNM